MLLTIGIINTIAVLHTATNTSSWCAEVNEKAAVILITVC